MNLTLTGRKKNVILTSNSKDNAVRLLDPYRANLEANGRIMAYYGKQELPGSWTEDEFTTKGKVSFRALGADNLRVVRETRPYVPTYCWSMTLIRTRIPRTRTSSRSAGTGGKCAVSHKVHFRTYTGHLLRKHHRQGLLRGEGGRNGRLLGHREHPRQKRFFHMAGKELGKDIDRTLSKYPKGGTGRIFQQPDFRGRGIRNIAYGKVPALSKFKFLVVYGDPARAKARVRKANPSRRFRSVANWVAGLRHQDFPGTGAQCGVMTGMSDA